MTWDKERARHARGIEELTEGWGPRETVATYLDRCRVDTPADLVAELWARVHERRASVRIVFDFGAGDGRFAAAGKYESYVGFEIDESRCVRKTLSNRAVLLNQCAFSQDVHDADLCIGNPPYVRNQDLPRGWRRLVAGTLEKRTGVAISGLANAWQYFFLLALASTKIDGLVSLLVPYEWVSRPSAQAIRDYIRGNRWGVYVYRLRDEAFSRVLTTSSITIIDKSEKRGSWRYFEEIERGVYRRLKSPSGGSKGFIAYAGGHVKTRNSVRAKRGLSPGTQDVLVLTEGERIRAGLKIGSDVVACVTSLRPIDAHCEIMTPTVFRQRFQLTGVKCWLIRTERPLSPRLYGYLANVRPDRYQTSTCLSREHWWEFNMPGVPRLLVATGFRGERPKAVVNRVRARAVGSVCGVYGLANRHTLRLVRAIKRLKLSCSIVSHSKGFRKLEVNQLNTLLDSLVKDVNAGV